MSVSLSSIFLNVLKVQLFCLLIFVGLTGNAQTCECPLPNTCNPCQSGMTGFTIKFNGTSTSTVTVVDQSGTIYSNTQSPGSNFSIVGTQSNGRFKGNQITLSVGGVTNAIISTSCSNPVFVGELYGNFKIVSGTSQGGGLICCSASTAETVPPVISNCPNDVTVTLGASACSTSGNWTAPIAIDNCAMQSLTSTHNPGQQFSSGATPVTYTAMDVFGNIAICSFNVIVNDVTPPIISGCPSDITVDAGTACQIQVSWTVPVANDNCGVTALTSTHTPGSSFPTGTTIVEYIAADAAGNNATCDFTVTVTSMGGGSSCCTGGSSDNNSPTISNCPVDILLTLGASVCSTAVNWSLPMATDDCGVDNFYSTHSPGQQFSSGVTPVTYTATDLSGNIAICSFNVIVNDVTPPVISACPLDITMDAGSACELQVLWIEPFANDNCAVNVFTGSHESGSSFPIGITNLTYTATDATGNSATCQFKITITSQAKPIITCGPNIEASAVFESEMVNISWEEPTASFTCGPVTISSNFQSGSQFPIGKTKVEYTATTEKGLTANCFFDVVVAFKVLIAEPNKVITPNGDGLNDTWQIKNIERYNDNRVVIVDRWGGLVYEASSYNNGTIAWDGSSKKGGSAPTGTYFYTLVVERADGKQEKTGFIELIR